MLAAGFGWTLWAALWCCCVASRPFPDPSFPHLRRPHRHERADRPAEFRPPSGGRPAGGGADSPERDRCSLFTRRLVAMAPNATAVILARALSLSSDPRANLSVTFKVNKVLKLGRGVILKPDKHVRLQVSRDGCWGPPRTGNVYLLLLDPGPSKLASPLLLAAPAARSPVLVKDIKAILKPSTVSRPPGVVGMEDSSVHIGDNVSLICKLRGRPLPKIAWFKDEKPLSLQSSRIQPHTRRRVAELVISDVQPQDSGVYECQVIEEGRQRAHPKSSKARLTVQEDPANESKTCPFRHPDVFCLNGGTCIYIEEVGEIACKCPEGFSGHRCGIKNVLNRTSMYHPYTCTLGLKLAYYC